MLIDAFLYNGERDMLDLRVAALRQHVDRMVAVCCDLTHQSDPNPIPDVPANVELLVVEAAPIPEGRGGNGTPYYQWIERQHRDGVRQIKANGSDVVLVSDVDEIPDDRTLDAIACAVPAGPVAVPMRMHGFALNYLYPSTWTGTTASTGALLAPQAHRNWRHKLTKVGAGVHLSWMGDIDEKRRKLNSFSHAELADLDLESCYSNGIHANGEVMKVLSRSEVLSLDWPLDLACYSIPPSWWAPEV